MLLRIQKQTLSVSLNSAHITGGIRVRVANCTASTLCTTDLDYTIIPLFFEKRIGSVRKLSKSSLENGFPGDGRRCAPAHTHGPPALP